MKSEEEKYVELIISMSSDFLLRKITFDHYANTLDNINNHIQIMNYEDNQRIADNILEEL